jgi:hypothetical protein
VKIAVLKVLNDRAAGCALSVTVATEGAKIQMSAVDNEKLLSDLKSRRYISFNSLVTSVTQLKKIISLLEERIQKEGDNINFSVNSDVIENAMMLWKASHKIYQIDDLITQLTAHQEKINEAAPASAGDTTQTVEGGNTDCQINSTEANP